MSGSETVRRQAEADLRSAVGGYLDDPLEPPAAESVRGLVVTLGDFLDVTWPAGLASAPDGVRMALIARAADPVPLPGAVVRLPGGARPSHRLRPMAADLARDAGTVRIGSANGEVAIGSSAELRFADATVVRQWERTVRYPSVF
jgi:hypothetical protein